MLSEVASRDVDDQPGLRTTASGRGEREAGKMEGGASRGTAAQRKKPEALGQVEDQAQRKGTLQKTSV